MMMHHLRPCDAVQITAWEDRGLLTRTQITCFLADLRRVRKVVAIDEVLSEVEALERYKNKFVTPYERADDLSGSPHSGGSGHTAFTLLWS